MTGSSHRSGSSSRRVALPFAGVLALALAFTIGWRAWRSARTEEVFQRAVAGARAGQLGPAVEAIEALRRIDPDDRRLPAAEGELELARGATPAARLRFERAVERDPGRGWSWARLGYLRALAGNHAGATSALERALQLEPSLWQAHRHLAELSVRRGDRRAAEAHLAAELALRPPAQRAQARADADLLRRRLARSDSAGPTRAVEGDAP
jgi:predicted Zn-dependent protease